MGFRFRKSVKIAPGVRLNIGKKSVGISAGVKGARVSVNSSGRKTTTVGIPGTGLSYQKTEKIGSHAATDKHDQTAPEYTPTVDLPPIDPQPPRPPKPMKLCYNATIHNWADSAHRQQINHSVTGGFPNMKSKVTVTIAQREYTLISDEGEAYVEKVAGYVSGQIQEMTRTAGVSSMDAAVLAAANIADSYFKEMEASERLRRQLKEALDESAQMKADLSEAKREIFRLSSGKDKK